MRRRLQGVSVAVAACVSVVALPTISSASTATITEAGAQKQLRQVENFDSGPAHLSPTAALRDLALALPALDGAAARRARAILSRPPDSNPNRDPFGGSWPGSAVEMVYETPDFVVHWAEIPSCDVDDEGCDEPDLTDAMPANGVPDYVEAMAAAVDDSISVENTELGWPLAKGDGSGGEPGGSGDSDRFDVYISDLCGFGDCIFGYANIDDKSAECKSEPFNCHSYLVNDNDYDLSEFGESGGLLGVRVTTAHEYNHVLQFGIDAKQNLWMLESTATWMEEQVFPDDDDWVRSYMGKWSETSTRPITTFRAGRGLRMYGSSIWNHWLENGDASYGPDIVLNAWLGSRETDPKDYAIGAYDAAIEEEGGEGFPQEFTQFTAATAEWAAGDGNLPDDSELPDIERQGKVKLGAKGTKQTLDNTSYAVWDVDPENAGTLKLKASSPGGVRWGVALVGRTGDRTTGTVTRVAEYAGSGEKHTVTLANAQTFSRISAVVTNADGRPKKPRRGRDGFSYKKDDQKFKLKVR